MFSKLTTKNYIINVNESSPNFAPVIKQIIKKQ